MYNKVLQIAIPFIWFGMLGAISFMETPLKFQAPGITLPLGLGIGRLMFFYMNKIELAFAVLMVVLLLIQRPRTRSPRIAFGVVLVLLLLETFWLLPALDVRTTAVINGTAEPFSNLHWYYIACDAIKLILLFMLGVVLAKQHLSYEGNNARYR